jgi:hypothetical protein
LPFSEGRRLSNLVTWIKPDGMSALDIGASDQKFCLPYFELVVRIGAVCAVDGAILGQQKHVLTLPVFRSVLVTHAWFL